MVLSLMEAAHDTSLVCGLLAQSNLHLNVVLNHDTFLKTCSVDFSLNTDFGITWWFNVVS